MTTREQAIAEQVCMTPERCDDCAESFRGYMATDAVWCATGLPEYGALLCLPCLQDRVGRQLTSDDLLDAPVNGWFQS